MDNSVGHVLHDARTRRGIDLTEAERVTKIRVKFLRAMEEDRWKALPAPVYARSFLATYARFLGLDGKELVEHYDRTAGEDVHGEPIPLGAIRAGGVTPRRRPLKPTLIVVAALALIVLLGIAIAGSLGGGGGGAGNPQGKRAGNPAPSGTSATRSTPVTGSTVSLELRSTASVWVCLVGAGDRSLLAETLPAGERRGPFESRSFAVTFGNGSIEMTVNGEPARIPPLAEPLGFRITTGGVHRLDPASEPTCA